jgi:hypothetical protein
MPKMQKIRNLFLLVGRDEQFLGGTLVKEVENTWIKI